MSSNIKISDYREEGALADVVTFLALWACGSLEAAEEHVSDHSSGQGTTLVARQNGAVVGIVTIRWRSNNPVFATRNIPLIHQLSVAQEHRRKGVATALMNAAEELAHSRGIHEIGITVGLPEDYGPAQRLYAKRGYIPDGRGVCRGRESIAKGSIVTVDDDLILWLTKTL